MLQHPLWEMIPKFLSSYEPFSFFSSLGYLSGSEGEERKNLGDKPYVILGEGVYTEASQGHH